MKSTNLSPKFSRITSGLLVMSVLSAGCGEDKPSSVAAEKTVIAETAVKGIKTVTLSALGLQRIDLKTSKVAQGTNGKEIPYSAVIYAPDGATWTFVSTTAARTFQRNAIAIERIDGEIAYLSDGPDVGADVVSQGAAQLYGAEFGLGH